MSMGGLSARHWIPIAGLVIGLVLGLVYQWGVAPVELVNTYPALLRTDYRSDWVRMAALSYVADGDMARVRARLEGLERQDVVETLSALIEEYAAAGRPADTMRRLSTLAEALDVHTTAMLLYLHTPAPPASTLPAPTSTRAPFPSPTPSTSTAPPPTFTPTPTRYVSSPLPTPTPELTGTLPTPAPTPTPPFLRRLEMVGQEQICEPEQPVHIEVLVQDERGAGVAGVEVWLMWDGGADRAVTGLKPPHGAGYADFNVEPGVRYSLGVGELAMPLATGLQVEPCPDTDFSGSWRILLAPRSP